MRVVFVIIIYIQIQDINMVFTARIDSGTRAKVYYLRNVKGFSTRKVAELCGVSRESVARISRENRDTRVLRLRSRSSDRRRPRKLTSRQIRLLLRCLKSLCIEQGNFIAKRVMEEAGIRESEISVRSITRYLNEHGYFYLQARKKGLMWNDDLRKRLDFAKYCQKNYPANFWTDHVSFYLDGTGFAHKTNPLDQAKAPK